MSKFKFKVTPTGIKVGAVSISWNELDAAREHQIPRTWMVYWLDGSYTRITGTSLQKALRNSGFGLIDQPNTHSYRQETERSLVWSPELCTWVDRFRS